MRTFHQSVTDILAKLDDPARANAQPVWSRAEIGLYLARSCDEMCRSANAIFDMAYPQEPLPTTVQTLPEKYAVIDRITWDWRTLYPEYHRYVAGLSANYGTVQGNPERFVAEKDGLYSLRLVPVPGGDPASYTHVGSRGIFRYASAGELGPETPTGQRGLVRDVPEQFPIGSAWGTARRLYSDEHNTRVEYFRKGIQTDYYEIPDHYCRYVEFGAMAQALKREGPAQDLKLSEHYKARFDYGVGRIKFRTSEIHNKRTGQIGGRASGAGSAPPMCRLPWQYGSSTRSGGGY